MALLSVETTGRVASIVINRPEKRNAFTNDMWSELQRLVEQIAGDDVAKVVVLRSSDERVFSAGADIGELREVQRDPARVASYGQAYRGAEAALAACPKPTIAMVSGFCVGGGCSVAVACDFRFADSTSKFGITPAKLGIVYSLVSTKRLLDVVGPTRAKQLLMSGELIDAEQALRIGLVTELFEPGRLREMTYAFAETLASRAQLTVRGAKRMVSLILSGAEGETDETQALETQAYASHDYREGVEAFLEGRPPRFE